MLRRFLPLLCCALALGAAEPAAAPKSPNVLMIVSDDQAWNDYGFMGAPVVRTPHIDRLAAESRAFRRGYDTNSLCSPSLASILTGLHVHRHGVTGNDPPWPAGTVMNAKRYELESFRRGREELTQLWERNPVLPKLLAERGYISLQTGKWWLGDYTRGGFTDGMTKGGRHGDVGLDIGRKTLAPVTEYITHAKEQGKPFFIWYAPMMPHDPHTPPERILAKYRDKTPSIHVARYWAMVEWFDETVGALRAHLEKEGLTKDTIIVYFSDNGWIQQPNSPKFDERSKQSPFDGGIRTPLLVSYPGHVAPGFVDTPVSTVDVMPTLLKLCGARTPTGLDGIDLLDDAAVRSRDAVFGSNSTHDIVEIGRPATSLRYRWVVAGEWKLIVSSGLNDATEPPRLFNLLDDPTEAKDLASAKPEIVARLRTRLDGWWDGKK